MPTKCRETELVAKLFRENRITGDSPLNSLTYIGPYIQNRMQNLPHGILHLNAATQQAPHHIQTLHEFVTKVSQARTQKNVDIFIEYCTYNRRRNTCVRQGAEKPDYHVADVNVCGYNSLLALVKYIHAHPNTPNFPGPYHLALAVKLKSRDRGSAGGSRYCSCISNEQTCLAHGDACRWNVAHTTCQSKTRGRQPGFKGVRLGNNQHLSQKIGNVHQVEKHGERYKGGWRQPRNNNGGDNGNDVVVVEAQDEVALEPENVNDVEAREEAMPEPNNNQNLRRSNRRRRPVQRYGFGGGGSDSLNTYFSTREFKYIQKQLRGMEKLRGGTAKMSGARRALNFIQLTSVFE